MVIQEITLEDGATLCAYLQTPSSEMPYWQARPAVLIFPGGGYRYCSEREAEPIALSFAADGYQAFVLHYTVGVNFAASFSSAEQAFCFLQQNAQTLHLQADKIAVIGFSAGGHLAAALGTMGTQRPSALLLCYPCVFANKESLAFSVPNVAAAVDAQTPPTFLTSTSEDTVVPSQNALAFATELANISVPYELHIFRRGAHGLAMATKQTDAKVERLPYAQWFSLASIWLEDLWYCDNQ